MRAREQRRHCVSQYKKDLWLCKTKRMSSRLPRFTALERELEGQETRIRARQCVSVGCCCALLCSVLLAMVLVGPIAIVLTHGYQAEKDQCAACGENATETDRAQASMLLLTIEISTWLAWVPVFGGILMLYCGLMYSKNTYASEASLTRGQKTGAAVVLVPTLVAYAVIGMMNGMVWGGGVALCSDCAALAHYSVAVTVYSALLFVGASWLSFRIART